MENNVCTVEDPIEYDLEGISQTQINSKIEQRLRVKVLGDWWDLGPQHFFSAVFTPVFPAQVLLIRSKVFMGRLAGALGQFLEAGFVDIEQTCEHQERNLFDDGERVGDAAGPEAVPEGVDLGAHVDRDAD